MFTVLIISMSNLEEDVRVMRHIEALKSDFIIKTIGYGNKPNGVCEHISIPIKTKYLPLNPGALFPHLFRFYRKSSQKTAAVRFVTKLLHNHSFDLVILNDVQTLPLLESLNCKTIVDMHEYAPREMDDDWRFRWFLMRYYGWLCESYLTRANVVTTVSQSLAEEYKSKFGVEAKVILNARNFLEIEMRPTISPRLRMIHTGLANRNRSLEVMIDAIAQIPSVSLDLFLVAAPRQQGTLRRLKRLVIATNNVRIFEPVKSAELPKLINEYDLSLVYFSPKCFSVNNSMPNKLFDSIQARVGIVCGPSPNIVEFCSKHGVGVATDEFSSRALQNLIMQLSVNSINKLKEECDHVAKSVNAESEATKLKLLVQSCLN